MIPEIKWLQKYDKVRITISMSRINEVKPDNCQISMLDNILQFKYDDYEFKEEFNHSANWKYDVKYRGMYIQVILLKQQQMEEWDFLFKNRKFNKTHVKVDWSDWTFEEERVSDMFTKHAGDENINKMMEQYQLGEEGFEKKDEDKEKENSVETQNSSSLTSSS